MFVTVVDLIAYQHWHTICWKPWSKVRKIFVGGIPQQVTQDDLVAHAPVDLGAFGVLAVDGQEGCITGTMHWTVLQYRRS